MIEFESYKLTDDDAVIVHNLIRDQLAAVKNWTLSAIERDDFDRAKKLTRDARKLQELYATFNVKVRRDLADSSIGNDLDRIQGLIV